MDPHSKKDKSKAKSQAGVDEVERANLESNASVEEQSKGFYLGFGETFLPITVRMSSLSLPLANFVDETPAIKESLGHHLEQRGVEVSLGPLSVTFTPEPQSHHQTARDWLYSQSKWPSYVHFEVSAVSDTAADDACRES